MSKAVATGYQVRWRKTSDPADQWSTPVSVGADGHVNVPGLQSINDYVFEARAVSACGAMSDWATQQFNHPAPDMPAPSLPSTIGMPDGVHVVFTSDPMRADLSYEIQRAPDNNGAPGTWATVAITKSTVWDDYVSDTNKYWYRFRTIDYQGNTSDWVAISSPVSATVSTPAINEAMQAANAAIGQTQRDVSDLQTQADSTLAQVQTLQGQVGDILQADVWDATKTYPLGDLVQYSGKLYRSLIDNNLNHEPTGATDANWEYIGNYASLGAAVGATAANVATLQNTVSQQGDDITANSQSISQNAAAIGTKADASALQATNATVTQQGDTLTSQGQSLTALTNTVNDPNTGLGTKATSAALTSLSNTVTQQGQDIAANEQAITSVQGSVGDVNSRVDTEQSARQAGDAANASAITAVQAGTISPGTNLCPNPSGATSLTGWSAFGSSGTLGRTQNPADPYAPYFTISATAVGGGVASIPARANTTYTVGADVLCSSTTKYIQPAAYDSTGTFIAYLTTASGVASSSFDRLTTTFTTPTNTASVSLYMQVNATTSQLAWRRVKMELGSVATAYNEVAQSAQTASAVLDLQAGTTVGGTTYASATLMVDANGNVALMRMNADGTTSNIVFKADTVSIVGSNAAGSTTFSGGLMTVKDNAGNTVVQLGLLP